MIASVRICHIGGSWRRGSVIRDGVPIAALLVSPGRRGLVWPGCSCRRGWSRLLVARTIRQLRRRGTLAGLFDATRILQLRGFCGREVTLPRGHLLSAGLNTSFDGLFIAPTYTPDATVLGARPNFSLAVRALLQCDIGNSWPGPSHRLSRTLCLAAAIFIQRRNSIWNAGVHNFMTYLTGDIPVGS